ncbi:retrovirus-related pol polyprotein from transposon TNT 1-94 [Tanacetum coccineum]
MVDLAILTSHTLLLLRALPLDNPTAAQIPFASHPVYNSFILPRSPQAEWLLSKDGTRTLVDVQLVTMLNLSKGTMFLWAEAVATAVTPKTVPYSPRHDKTTYELKSSGIYNKRTRQIMETIHVQFDELTEQMAPGPSVSISIDLDAPSGSHISSPLDHHSSSVHHGVAGEQYAEVNPFAAADPEPFVNVFAPDPTSEASSSGEIMMPELNQSTQPHEHIQKWTDSHPLDNIIGNPSRPVSTRKQLATDALWCFYNSVLSKVEPKNFKSAATEDCWFQAMQEEIHEFDRLDVWELVPPPNSAMIIALKWIYKVKLDEYGDVLKNKARYGANGF